MVALMALSDMDSRLVLLCDAYLRKADVPGASVAMVVEDAGYHFAYGVRSTVTRDPVTAQTGFNVGSCSKAFVSTTLASLVADDLVTWDEPIRKFVPEFQLYDPWVSDHATLRDLSANRLGLPRTGLCEYGCDPDFPAAYIFENLKYTQPIHPFRDRFTYINCGHAANAVAIGRISGAGFLATLRNRILGPLGMTSTSGGIAARDDLPDQAAWHVICDGGAVPIDTVYTDQYLGAGGMVIAGADAVQWLRLHLNNGKAGDKQIVPGEELGETYRPHSPARPGKDPPSLFYPEARMAAYGLGWGISDFMGHPLVCHSGNDYGVQAFTLLLPQDGIGISVNCNCAGGTAVEIGYALASALLKLEQRDWKAYFASYKPKPPPSPEEPIAEQPGQPDLAIYAGEYWHPANGPLVIAHESGGLSGCLTSGYRMGFNLSPIGAGRFRLSFSSPEWSSLETQNELAFEFGEQANPVCARVTIRGVEWDPFERRLPSTTQETAVPGI